MNMEFKELGESQAISDKEQMNPMEGSKKCVTKSLFPSAGEMSSAKDVKMEIGYHDWLENKSFTSETAKMFQEFHQEFEALQNKESHHLYSASYETEQCSSRPESLMKTREMCLEIDKEYKKTKTHDSKYESNSTSDRNSNFYKTSGRTDKCLHDAHKSEREEYQQIKQHRVKKCKKKHSKDRHEVHNDKPLEIPGLYVSSKVFKEELDDTTIENAFRLHRQPDINNWTYGAIYKQHIASYRTHCVTCVGNQEIYLESKKKKRKVENHRYFARENRQLLKQPAAVVLVSKINDDTSILSKNKGELFVPVLTNKDSNKQVEYGDVRQKILDVSTSLYLKGKGVAVDNIEGSEPVFDPVVHKVAEYNRKLRENPNDIKLWLEFIKFQDTLENDYTEYSKIETVSGGVQQSNKCSILDKKLSIIDKALASNPGNIDLLLMKFELSSEIIEFSQILKDLDQLLFVHPANTKLWRYYLMFNQSRLSTFTVTKMSKVYHKCFKTLFAILAGEMQTHSKPNNLEEEIVEIFFQYCHFLKQAGYKERALASYQAQIEFNFFCPSSLDSASRKTKLSAFEEFWDSGCARVCMAGAKGWSTWFELKKNGQGGSVELSQQLPDCLEKVEESIIEKKLSKFECWLEIETLRDHHHWLPWLPDVTKGQTEDDCEDVERLVMFDDISPVLFNISKCLHFPVLISFLEFLGVETNVHNSIQTFRLELFSEYISSVTKNRAHIREVEIYKMTDSETLNSLIVELLICLIPCFSGRERSDLTLILIEVKLRSFKHKNLSKDDKKKMRNILKNILKEEHSRNDLYIWCAYINVEKSIGKPEEAESIVQTALLIYSGESLDQYSDKVNGVISLYTQYVEMLLKIDRDMPTVMLPRTTPVTLETRKKVMSILSCMVEGKKFIKDCQELSSAGILRTCAKFAKLIESTYSLLLISVGQNSHINDKLIQLTWCSALFLYCRSDLQCALDVYNMISVLESSTSPQMILHILKCLYANKLKLIVYHMSVCSSPLHILRNNLDLALEKFPDNPVFLSLFIDIERRSRITGRLNKFFDKHCRSPASFSASVFAVCLQLDFLQELKASGCEDERLSTSGVFNRARTWLEYSLSQSKQEHCPLLWRLYIQLEKYAGHAGRQKGVYYRAVQQCPWLKNIYLDGIKLFGVDQLQEIVDLMTEKELRVQIPVEELDILIS